jgi:ribosomal protein L12E/L44/L45/RPP1/RPP2
MAEKSRLACLLEKIGAAQDNNELTAIAAEIKEYDLDEWTLEQLTDAIREARERLSDK